MTYNIHNTRVCSRNKHNQANGENNSIDRAEDHVLGGEVASFADKHEPHDSREVESETGDEEGGDNRQKVIEERNHLGNNELENGQDGDDNQPGGPSHLGVDEADVGALEDPAVDQSSQHYRVDRTTNKDHRECDTKCDTAKKATGGQQGGALDVLANESVAQGTGDCVDEDLGETEGPDGLGEIGGGVHLVHEGELAEGEAVGEDDVGQSDEGIGEGDTLLGPGGPVHSSQTGAVGGLDTSSDDSDTDSEDNRGEINVSQNSHLGEAGGDGEKQQDDGGDNTEDDGTDVATGDVGESNSSSETVRAGRQQELQTQHQVQNLVSPSTKHLATGFGVVGDVRELDLDLTDNVTGVDRNEANANAADDTRHHAQSGKGLRNGQTSQRNSLDDQNDSQALPSQSVELLHTTLVDLLLAVVHIDIHAEILDLRTDLIGSILLVGKHRDGVEARTDRGKFQVPSSNVRK